MLTVAIDIGGVLSKYHEIRKMLAALRVAADCRVIIVTDMTAPRAAIMLVANGYDALIPNTYSADYQRHGGGCKAELCHALGVDILIDDDPTYAAVGRFVRLMVQPDPSRPYYSPDWITPGEEKFGRVIYVPSKRTGT